MRRSSMRNIIVYAFILILVFVSLRFFSGSFFEGDRANVNTFINDIKDGKVKRISQEGYGFKYTKNDGKSDYVEVDPNVWKSIYDDYVKDRVISDKLQYDVTMPRDNSMMINILMMLGSMIFFMFIMRALVSPRGQDGTSPQNFGRSRARESKTVNGKVVKFADVAGLVEEKEELFEIVDFLKNPMKYIKLGARIPKGVLLVGEPGTGKTYLSKAVAGEAGVPFYTISGSDFVEMFVGVGASRVRDLFQTAKKNAPCIVFIDEIDAVGRQRGAGLGGGNDEREQTLNQLLVEMDGFSQNEGIIVMAATNRPDILDKALLRPGRFDRNIYVSLPDVKAREAILEVHAKNKKIDEDVDLENIAKKTVGFSPADLENLLNEAALLTARENLDKIPMRLVQEASIKVVAGPEKKSQTVIEKERQIVAYHEAGHAIVSHYTDELYPVNMITIVPRGRAGGFTEYLPKEDFNYTTKSMMENMLKSLLGGRIAEEIIFKDISTGASNDIERATDLAKNMVTVYGMSEKLGPVCYDNEGENVFIGRDYGRTKVYSEEVQYAIDQEIKDFILKAKEEATQILLEHKDKLEKLAQTLLEKETINRQEFLAVLGE
ncbi:MAG: ATP-dependent zinc metalloprotease FtsH [Eubacteriales bacterium]|uniref:ATP-dependent zinc metalloprotease FtsH n=1 Tax=Fenollaria sp. TaxID=1965292 RepID=UPI002A74E735|nr:ATP-dependent zinc metalloprotease FtsH [Fenollaria sp.]MDD7340290.1 ATP-dependent zinc metalloprotease FtsH [Eubacteriales bacterium]MDY3105867.1 ATP-dependent zinc metalloprotease FtsH [Fenollaria sp.]